MRKQIGKLTGILLHLLLLQFSSQAQTWNSEIGCIVYSHCSSCHRPGGIGPFSLSSYFEAFQHKESIAQSVQTRMMPPFPPDQAKRKLAHANTLSAQEIDAIVSWAENNAPLGTGAEPELPVFTSENEITDPETIPLIQLPGMITGYSFCR
jgi:mono/diheme cytochrome c family protein